MIEVRTRSMFGVQPQQREPATIIDRHPYRVCQRCGKRNMVRNNQVRGEYICQDCKLVDPEFGKGNVMSRVSYAVQQLEAQVRAHRPDAEVTHTDADGFGVFRTVRFDKDTSKWLWPLLQPLDGRFARGELSGGVLTLAVQTGSLLADDRSAFDGIGEPEVSSALDTPEQVAPVEVPDAVDPPADPVAPKAKPSAKPRQSRGG